MKKKFEGYLILNWKTKAMTIKKRKPKNVEPFEIPVKVDIDVEVPQVPTVTLKGTIEIPETKVGEMVIEAI